MGTGTWVALFALGLPLCHPEDSATQDRIRRKPELRERESLFDRISTEVLKRAAKLCRQGSRGLVRLQRDDGSFSPGNARNPAPIAVTALSALALLSTGEVPGRTPAGRRVERAIRFLVDHQDRSGGPTHGYISIDSDQFSKMHGQGYATLALAQVVGMLPAADVALVTQKEARAALVDAVRLIEKCQDPNTGGWWYDPAPTRHEGSMTICMVQALRAAKDAGVTVNLDVIRKAIRYVELSQKPDGSFRYMLGDDKSTTALTAAAVMTLNASGAYDNPVLRKGLSYLTDRSDVFRRSLSLRPSGGQRFPYYERLYVGEALFTARDQGPFIRWFRNLVPEMEGAIDPATDLWSSPAYSDAYATAMTVLVLSLPLQYLPIHQR